jgi:hypothetical protein
VRKAAGQGERSRIKGIISDDATANEPRPARFFVDVRTGVYHASLGCPEYTLPQGTWWAYPHYQKKI